MSSRAWRSVRRTATVQRGGSQVASAIMMVESGPADAEREAGYNEWYSKVHIPEMCSIPGVVSARRYKVRDAGRIKADASKRPYVAIYELECDDINQPLSEFFARYADGRMTTSDTVQMSPPALITIYEPSS